MKRTQLFTSLLAISFMVFSFVSVNAQSVQADKAKTIETQKRSTSVKPATQSQRATPATPATPAKPTSIRPTSAANANNDLTGYWLTAQKGSIIEFKKNGEFYEGKVVWSKNAKGRDGKPLKDVNNPDKSKRSNPLKGTTMISGLKYNPKTDTYEGGKIYQPNTGRTFNCKVNLDKSKNVMQIVGGVGFISKTLTWTRTSGVPGK